MFATGREFDGQLFHRDQPVERDVVVRYDVNTRNEKKKKKHYKKKKKTERQ